MRHIRVTEFGAPSVLRYEESADLILGSGEVRIDVKAVGVNPVDTYIRSGSYPKLPPLPYTPGADCAGVVTAVGSEATGIAIGSRVYTRATVSGAYATVATAKAADVHILPDSVSFEQGASIGVPYFTAYRALVQRANARAGEWVFVHGASGGVGIAALQVARACGLRVAGTAGSDAGMQIVKENGAQSVFNHHKVTYLQQAYAATDGVGFDIILEMLANVNLPKDLEIVALYGRIVVIGNRGTVEINPRAAMGRDASILGMNLFNMPASLAPEAVAFIGAGLENGTLHPVVGQTFPLAKAAAAHEAIMAGGASGKIVLIP